VLEPRYYLATGGDSPFESWFSDLDAPRRAGSVTLVRLGAGQCLEYEKRGRGGARIPDRLGPGYRVYFGAVILLTGGTKQRQQRDIERAKDAGGLQAAAQAAETLIGDERWR
jgi:putative addiction module killer protein